MKGINEKIDALNVTGMTKILNTLSAAIPPEHNLTNGKVYKFP